MCVVLGACQKMLAAPSTTHTTHRQTHTACVFTRVVCHHQHPTRWHGYHCTAPRICWPFKHPAQTSLSTLPPIQTVLWPGLHVATPNTQNSAARHTLTHAESCDGLHHQQRPPHHSKRRQRQHVTLSRSNQSFQLEAAHALTGAQTRSTHAVRVCMTVESTDCGPPGKHHDLLCSIRPAHLHSCCCWGQSSCRNTQLHRQAWACVAHAWHAAGAGLSVLLLPPMPHRANLLHMRAISADSTNLSSKAPST